MHHHKSKRNNLQRRGVKHHEGGNVIDINECFIWNMGFYSIDTHVIYWTKCAIRFV